MSSIYRTMREVNVPEDVRSEIEEAISCEREEWAQREEISKLKDRFDRLERSLTEVRCKVFGIPSKFDEKGMCIVELG